MASEITSTNTQFDIGSVIDNNWVLIERIGKGGIRMDDSEMSDTEKKVFQCSTHRSLLIMKPEAD